MRKISVPNGFLAEAAETLRKGQAVTLRIDGNSMYPFIRGGRDLVEIVPCPPGTRPIPWACYFYCWEGQYMVHRYVGQKAGTLCMMGDGNLGRIEHIRPEDLAGMLQHIRRPDGTIQDCLSPAWLKRGRRWYRLRHLRRWLLPLLHLLGGPA